MRVNVKEVAALATQPGYRFAKEGILSIQEKHEGLFRSYEAFVERWCRLRGNLFFYFKGNNESSTPLGVVVLENCAVSVDTQAEVPYCFVLSFAEDTNVFRFAAKSEEERDDWIRAIQDASFEHLRTEFISLQKALQTKEGAKVSSPIVLEPKDVRTKTFTALSLLEPFHDDSYLEISLSCFKLCSDDTGIINPVAVIFIMRENEDQWTEYAQTETLERTSCPRFLTTIVFHKNDVKSLKWLKISVCNVKELVTSTKLPIGDSMINFGSLLTSKTDVISLTLISLNLAPVGQIKIQISHLDPDLKLAHNQTYSSMPNITETVRCSRSLSLPAVGSADPQPIFEGHLSSLYGNICGQTYCFKTSSGKDLHVREIMADTTLSFSIPQMLLNLFIEEENCLLGYIGFLKTMKEEYHRKQIKLLEHHIRLVNTYTDICSYLTTYKGPAFKPSAKKAIQLLEFIPVNLHLQRMCVHKEESEEAAGLYDVITVGAFTAHSHRFYQGGLKRLRNVLYYVYNRSYPLPLTPDAMRLAALTVHQAVYLLREVNEDSHRLLFHFERQNTLEILEVIISISNKVQKYFEESSPQLVREALRLWEIIRDPYAKDICPRRASGGSHLQQGSPCSTCPKEQKENNTGYQADISNSVILKQWLQSHSFRRRRTSTGFVSGKFENCLNTVLNIVDSELDDESMLDSTYEFEPLDLIKVNIKASLVCITSKVQNMMQCNEKGQSNDDKVEINWKMEAMPSVQKLVESLESLVKTVKMTYCVHNLMADPDYVYQLHINRYRLDVVFTQALTSFLTAVMTRFWCRTMEPGFISALTSVGILAQFEGLLSCYGDEMGMIEDMVDGVAELESVTYLLEPYQPPLLPKPVIKGTRANLTVTIPIPEYCWREIPRTGSERTLQFNVSPLLFNIGINEQATLAERFGDTSLQEAINANSMRLLKKYCERLLQFQGTDTAGHKDFATRLNQLLNELQHLIDQKKSKNVNILHLAAKICRTVHGLRFTSCKSAKDRTGMGITLEQVLILKENFDLDDKEFSTALDCMRSQGTRRENTFKNVKVRKYAFNSLQLMTLPKQYRPPVGTYGNVQT